MAFVIYSKFKFSPSASVSCPHPSSTDRPKHNLKWNAFVMLRWEKNFLVRNVGTCQLIKKKPFLDCRHRGEVDFMFCFTFNFKKLPRDSDCDGNLLNFAFFDLFRWKNYVISGKIISLVVWCGILRC